MSINVKNVQLFVSENDDKNAYAKQKHYKIVVMFIIYVYVIIAQCN